MNNYFYNYFDETDFQVDDHFPFCHPRSDVTVRVTSMVIDDQPTYHVYGGDCNAGCQVGIAKFATSYDEALFHAAMMEAEVILYDLNEESNYLENCC